MGIEEDKTISYSSILLDYLFQEQRVKNKINFPFIFLESLAQIYVYPYNSL